MSVTVSGLGELLWLAFDFLGPTENGTELTPNNIFARVLADLDPGNTLYLQPSDHSAPSLSVLR